MIDTMAHQPQDLTLGIGDDHLTTTGPETDFPVGEIVADEFRAVHAIGMKTVALLDNPESQRKFNLFFIKCSTNV